MKKMILAAFFLLCIVGAANATLIDFNLDTQGNKPNGFQSVTGPGVTFTDTLQTNLYIGYWQESNYSAALGVFNDDGSKLRMDFSNGQNFLSLQFGNDENSSWVKDAVLELYFANVLVGQTVLTVNNNNLMDQTISYSGNNFDSALFYYRAADGNVANLIEVVDNINFANNVAPVPEPGTIALLGLGMTGLAIYGKRRKKA